MPRPSLLCRITSFDSPYLTGHNETVLTGSYEETQNDEEIRNDR